MQADFLLLIAMLLPILGSIPVFIVKKQGFRKAIMVLVLAIQVIVVAGIALTQHGSITFLTINDWLTFKLTADTLGKLFACLVAAGWLLVAIFAFDYFAKDERAHQFFGFFMITLGTIMGVCYSANLPTLYLFFEMMTFATLPIVVHYRTKKALNAGLKYLAYSIFGAGMALWGMFMLTQNAVSLDFTAGGTLDPVFAAQNRSEIILAYFIMMVGFSDDYRIRHKSRYVPDAFLDSGYLSGCSASRQCGAFGYGIEDGRPRYYKSNILYCRLHDCAVFLGADSAFYNGNDNYLHGQYACA